MIELMEKTAIHKPGEMNQPNTVSDAKISNGESASDQPGIKVRVLVFGQLAERTGEPLIELENITDTDTLKMRLRERYPLLSGMKYTIALNKKITHQNSAIGPGDELALMPPFSGG